MRGMKIVGTVLERISPGRREHDSLHLGPGSPVLAQGEALQGGEGTA